MMFLEESSELSQCAFSQKARPDDGCKCCYDRGRNKGTHRPQACPCLLDPEPRHPKPQPSDPLHSFIRSTNAHKYLPHAGLNPSSCRQSPDPLELILVGRADENPANMQYPIRLAQRGTSRHQGGESLQEGAPQGIGRRQVRPGRVGRGGGMCGWRRMSREKERGWNLWPSGAPRLQTGLGCCQWGEPGQRLIQS